MVEIGLVGKPSAGKSTFFAAATLANVPISSIPFTTIKPNIGTAYVRVEDIGKEFGVVPNPRFGFIKNGIRFVPIKLIDVAGLIPDAHKGKGLGNQFLNDLNEAEGLIHVVDLSGSTDAEGNFIGWGKRDPEEDIKFLVKELEYWIASIWERNLKKMERLKRSGKDERSIILEIFSSFRVNDEIADDLLSKFSSIEKIDALEFAQIIRERTKPIVIAGNKIDLPFADRNYERLKNKYDIIPVCAEAELALRKADKLGLIDYTPGDNNFKIIGKLSKEQEEALETIRKNVLEKYGSTGVQDVLDHIVFDVLGYKAVFPAGSKLKDKEGRVLPDCFLLPANATLYDFALKIHSDLAKHLLYGIDARTKKRLSKDYVIKHRDAIELVTTAK